MRLLNWRIDSPPPPLNPMNHRADPMNLRRLSLQRRSSLLRHQPALCLHRASPVPRVRCSVGSHRSRHLRRRCSGDRLRCRRGRRAFSARHDLTRRRPHHPHDPWPARRLRARHLLLPRRPRRLCLPRRPRRLCRPRRPRRQPHHRRWRHRRSTFRHRPHRRWIPDPPVFSARSERARCRMRAPPRSPTSLIPRSRQVRPMPRPLSRLHRRPSPCLRRYVVP